MSALTIPWAFSNVHRTGSHAQKLATITAVVERAKGGFGGFNEADLDHPTITAVAHQHGMSVLCAGENAAIWDDRFTLVAHFNFPIMRGGHVGADGTPAGRDNRRVGPSRFVLVVVLWDATTGQPFVAAFWHLVARSGTVAKWRRPLLMASIRRAGASLAQVLDDVSQGLLMGDTNWNPPIDLPGVADVPVPVDPTMGRAHYDKVMRFGSSTTVPHPATFRTPSDHRGIVGRVTFGGPAVPRPTVKVSSVGVVKPSGVKVAHPDTRPVRHPWARRTRRWKIRHPVLWRRIVRWRRAHPR